MKYFDKYHDLEIDEGLWKTTLIISTDLPWDEFISILRHLYPDGLFQDYNFEDAVFILFLCPQYPGYFYKKYYSERYESELKFYSNCLSCAIRKWIEEVKHITITVSGSEMKGETIAENVYYSYW